MGTSYPLTPNQWGILFHDLVHPGSRLYDVIWTCVVDGPLDDALATRALTEVTRHHEALRTRFEVQGVLEGGEGRQVVEDEPTIDLAHLDPDPGWAGRLGETDLDAEARAELSRLVADPPFDL